MLFYVNEAPCKAAVVDSLILMYLVFESKCSSLRGVYKFK